MCGYVILKVRDGIFLNKARTQFTRELNNEVSLCEVGWTSKAMYKEWDTQDSTVLKFGITC